MTWSSDAAKKGIGREGDIEGVMRRVQTSRGSSQGGILDRRGRRKDWPRLERSDTVRTTRRSFQSPPIPPMSNQGETTPEVSIIIPCYNEADTIGEVVGECRRILEEKGYAGEVLVVDNGSTDDSAAIALEAGAAVFSQRIRGYGAACIKGLEVARGDYNVLVDGDGTYSVESLHRFIEPLRSGYEMVLGTRRNGEIEPDAMAGWHRHVLEPLQTWMLRRKLGIPLSDVRCGIRALRREAAESMNFSNTGADFASEMLAEAERLDLEMLEIPVEFTARPGTPRRSTKSGWEVMRDTLLISPSATFWLPGAFVMALGVIGLGMLLGGPLEIGEIRLDYHWMFGASALVILGFQLVLLAIYGQSVNMVSRGGDMEPWVRRLHQWYRLERGLAIGTILFLLGVLVNAWLLGQWVATGGEEFFAVRSAIVALTAMVIGAEVVFSSIFLSFLRKDTFSEN